MIKFVDPSLQADKEVALAAVRNDGITLKYVDPSLKAEKEVVLAAVKQNGKAIQYANPVTRALLSQQNEPSHFLK
jgi:hypothetical protein